MTQDQQEPSLISDAKAISQVLGDVPASTEARDDYKKHVTGLEPKPHNGHDFPKLTPAEYMFFMVWRSL